MQSKVKSKTKVVKELIVGAKAKDFKHWKSYPKFEGREGYIYPRTMLQAFPTHTSHDIYEQYTELSRTDTRLISAFILSLGLAAFFTFVYLAN